MKPFELPEDRLGTTDEDGHRVALYPLEVKGKFRNLRNLVHPLMVFIFLALPLTTHNGTPLVLFHVAERRFYFFGQIFWAHDAPRLIFLLMAFVFGLFFLTSIFGRFWCGWACPQTVFIETLYRRFETWIEGKAQVRRKRDLQGMTLPTFLRKSLKWSVFVFISMGLALCFMSYFSDIREIRSVLEHPEQHGTFITFFIFFSAILLFDFGWFREQFCVIMCPYGRFQSVLMDQNSLTVTYDYNRGEPRRGKVAKGSPDEGDCVNCYKCVQVCPTGIDIRRGNQLECIACTACIDACDSIMTSLKRPKGLIRYDTERNLKVMRKGTKEKVPPTNRWRAMAYGFLLTIGLVGVFVQASFSKNYEVRVFRSKGSPYQLVKDENGTDLAVNHFKLFLANQSLHVLKIKTQLSDQELSRGLSLASSQNEWDVPPGESLRPHFFVKVPRREFELGEKLIQIRLFVFEEQKWKEIQTMEVKALGPL